MMIRFVTNLAPLALYAVALLAVTARKVHREYVPPAIAASSLSYPQPALLSLHPSRTKGLPPVMGKDIHYKIKPQESLLYAARHFNTDEGSLMRANGLKDTDVTPGQSIVIPGMQIVPDLTDNGIVLNVPERAVYVFRNDALVGRYPVAIGKRGWETPTGLYSVVRKVKDPVWIVPDVMVKREGLTKQKVTSKDNSPIGDRWIGWSRPEVGFHTTFAVDSVGKLASHACVRLYPEAAHRMFETVDIGMPIFSEYETIKLGQRDGQVYLTVLPDVYHMRKVTLERIEQRLAAAGVLDAVDRDRLKRIAHRQDGRAWWVAALPKANSDSP